MKELNLYRLFEICTLLSDKERELSENNTFVSLLGNRSSFSAYSFEQFLEYYSFKIEEDNIVVYNDDPIPYEQWDNDDVSYIPSVLLSFGEKDLEKWIEDEVEKQLKQQEKQKIAEKENIRKQIELLQKKLES